MKGLSKRLTAIRSHIWLLICILHFSSWAGVSLHDAPGAQPACADKTFVLSNSRQVASNPDSLVYQLTPTLTVVTQPLGSAKNNASVTIYNGSLLLYTVTITQTAPIAVCSFELVLGTVKIQQGMQFTLQIPSSLQPGSVFLQATFSDLNVPPTNISAMIATWNL